MNPVDFLKDSVDTPALLINEPVLQAYLYDEFHIFRGQDFIERWPITGRGRFT